MPRVAVPLHQRLSPLTFKHVRTRGGFFAGPANWLPEIFIPFLFGKSDKSLAAIVESKRL